MVSAFMDAHLVVTLYDSPPCKVRCMRGDYHENRTPQLMGARALWRWTVNGPRVRRRHPGFWASVFEPPGLP